MNAILNLKVYERVKCEIKKIMIVSLYHVCAQNPRAPVWVAVTDTQKPAVDLAMSDPAYAEARWLMVGQGDTVQFDHVICECGE